jgi:hypothetical protein
LYVAADVIGADRLTPLYLERGGRVDLAQIPTTAAAPPKTDRHGRGFVMLDASAAQHGISKVLVTAAQIRDYLYSADRSVCWTEQPSWFEVLGVRKNSTSAEIRLAYRVRMLELKKKASESNRSIQAQLARGLQILLDPDLRRDYLLLLKDPDASVAFPPWTIGVLRATGQKKGELFIVRDFLSFFPRTEERTVRLALRRFRFEGAQAVYRDARKRILIRFDSSLLPMEWTDKWNTWAHLALGSVTVKAMFWQQTRFRRTETGFSRESGRSHSRARWPYRTRRQSHPGSRRRAPSGNTFIRTQISWRSCARDWSRKRSRPNKPPSGVICRVFGPR